MLQQTAMAEALDLENAAFWLPSSFLADEDHFNANAINDEYSFGSPVSSTETERGDSICNDDDLVAELTRHLARSSLSQTHYSFNEKKPLNYSTSPQSTLSGFGPFTTRSGFSSNGSPNGPSSRVPSPPLTAPERNDAAWELLYEAASQVARLKMNALAAQMNHQHHHHYHHHQSNGGLLGGSRNVSLSSKPLLHHHHNSYNFHQYEQVKRQGNGNLYCQHNHNLNQERSVCNGGPVRVPHTTWANQRQPHGGPGMRSVYLNGPGSGPGPGTKRQSTGTGVFLPRRAGTTTQPPPPEPRKTPSGCPSILLQTRTMDALNKEFEKVKIGVNANPRVRYGSEMFSEQEIITARRNAMMEQQRRNLMRNDEIRLPSDWTY